MTRRQTIFIVLSIAACWGGALALSSSSKPASQVASRPSNTPMKPTTVVPTPAPDPLTIAAIRARKYPGSALKTEQDLGEQGGFHNAVVSYQSDGLTIYALMSTPNTLAPAGGWPVVILGHGYLNPAAYQTNGPEYRSIMAALAKAGYLVIKPDYRGHGRSQGVAEGGHFSPVYAYDLLNLIASVKLYAPANSRRIGLFAHSMSGHTALRAVVATPDVKATVFMAGVVGSFDDIMYNWPHSPVSADLPAATQVIRQNLLAKYGDSRQNPNFWASASAVNYASSIIGAVQINQDAQDSIVPKTFSDHLVSALQQAGKQPEYHVYPGDDHQFSINRAAFLQNVLAFYGAHL